LPGGNALLAGLRIGTTATAQEGLVLGGNAGTVVLDSLTVAAGPGFNAVRVDGCPQTALQDCKLIGDPGLRVANGSIAYVSRGDIDELVVESGSTVRHAGVTPGSTNTSGGAVVQALSGVMPHVGFPTTTHSGGVLSMTVTGSPGAFYSLFLPLAPAWFDLSFLGVDMVVLIDPVLNIAFANGVLAGGGATVGPIPIPPTPGLVGFPFAVQGVTVTSLTPFVGRMSNLREVVILP
ncbi:MAG TPA: hypothetical protein VKF62_00785, partial [Planctomycetota bacterium]|nr:hypothetical protein [Planctomycetota bacterium]